VDDSNKSVLFLKGLSDVSIQGLFLVIVCECETWAVSRREERVSENDSEDNVVI
jgi:hypothetical protein